MRFAYRGRHQELLRIITPADVRWMCSRLARLDEQQWRDAFRAGGYTRATTDRYILRIQQKIQQGLSLPDASRPGL